MTGAPQAYIRYVLCAAHARPNKTGASMGIGMGIHEANGKYHERITGNENYARSCVTQHETFGKDFQYHFARAPRAQWPDEAANYTFSRPTQFTNQ